MTLSPVILAHGFLGYRKVFFWEQFAGVEAALREKGIRSFRSQVHPTAPINDRAAELLEQINRFLGDDSSFHVIGHSMGGLDARYLASPGGLNQGHRILSITTLSTPHLGSPIADYFPPFLAHVAAWGALCLRPFTQDRDSRFFLSRLTEPVWKGLPQLQPAYLHNVFNPAVPDHPQVRYFSYAARRIPGSRTICGRFHRWIARRYFSDEKENDGMVAVPSACWGQFKGIVDADHADLVGIRFFPWTHPTFDHVGWILAIVDDLAKLESSCAIPG